MERNNAEMRLRRHPRHPDEEPEWYASGLTFHCTRCGDCCSGTAGHVWFTVPELEQMSRYLGLLPFEFLRRHARKVEGRYSLNEAPGARGLECEFLRRDPVTGLVSCAIYPVRPAQCRTWPFWPESLHSRASWRAAAAECPGIGRSAKTKDSFYDLDRIRRLKTSAGEP